MKTGSTHIYETDVRFSRLEDNSGNLRQFWYSIVPQRSEPIVDQLRRIAASEAALLQSAGIHPSAVAVKHMFSSDLINHLDEIRAYKARAESDFALFMTQQPPANGVKLALLCMCLGNITGKSREENLFLCDTTSGIHHIFVEHLTDPTANKGTGVEEQTSRVFAILKDKVSAHGATIADNVLRTWLYAPHVDADYPGIVQARKQLFDAINLTRDTHYIASTGIEGGSANRFARIAMDAYAATGSGVREVRYIQAPEYLSPTYIYGVTFERATAAHLGGTDFLFVSGTASIDKHGEIVHPGDVRRQAERTLENIQALLDAGGFRREDLSSFVVYLRDATDYAMVAPLIEGFREHLPMVFVKAPVCRPGWLIEIEATAARSTA